MTRKLYGDSIQENEEFQDVPDAQTTVARLVELRTVSQLVYSVIQLTIRKVTDLY